MDDTSTEHISIDLDEDILEVARDEAEREGTSVGKVISRLARGGFFAERPPMTYPDGFVPLPVRPGGRIVTLKHVQRIQQQIDYEDMMRALYPKCDRQDYVPD